MQTQKFNKFTQHMVETIMTLGEFRGNNKRDEYEVWDEEKQSWVSYQNSCYNQQGDFPHPESAKDPINLITIYDSFAKKFFSWGLKPYKSSDPNVVYTHCKREVDIYEKVLSFWEKDPPDIMTGWNTEGFDVPYLMNRISKLMSEEDAARLSPIKSLYYRENVAMNKFGKMINRWYIRGISNIDYMEVYKTFSRGD